MTMIADIGSADLIVRKRPQVREIPSLPAGVRGVLDDEGGFAHGLASLSETQLLVLALIARGQLNKQIAYICGIAPATVKSHVSEILHRLKVRSRTEAAVKYAVFVERRRIPGAADA